MNYYDLLEIQPTASEEVIRMAYKALVKKYHPDAYEGDKAYAEDLLQRINIAYEILSDKEKRARYDSEIEVLHVSESEEEAKKSKSNFSSTVVKEAPKYGGKKHRGLLIDLFWSLVYGLFSVLKYAVGIILLYVAIGLFTGNLKEWNDNLLYCVKGFGHAINNINLSIEYEEETAGEEIHRYIQAIFSGDEYTSLKIIDKNNAELKSMTEGLVKVFGQLDEDKVLSVLIKDMKKAEYVIEQGRTENEYIVTVTTCDYEQIVSQVDTTKSDAYMSRQINRRVRSAPKQFKKEVIVKMQMLDGKWYISSFEDNEIFIDALSGNLLGDTLSVLLQNIN